MKRARPKRRGGLSRDAQSLAWLAQGLADSGSRAEDRYWEQRLAEVLDRLLEESAEDTLVEGLDHLYDHSIPAYDELADLIEARVESGLCDRDGLEVVLVAAPVLAWSRYSIPASSVPPAALANLKVHLQAHVLADGVQVALADFLYSPDQLPQGYCATTEFTRVMAQAAQAGQNVHVLTEDLPETTQFLSDTRYLLAVVVAPKGAPLFRWQEADGSREQSLRQWAAQGGASLAPLMPGCALEVVLPQAYFAACRQADRDGRAYAIRASVAFLGSTLERPAVQLRAVIAPFHERKLEEYRIGFTLLEHNEVLHGVVWPLLGAEDENTDILGEIEAVLKDCGITDVLVLEHPFPLEYCDDCNAPLYPNPEGEVAHAEMPEVEETQVPRHLH